MGGKRKGSLGDGARKRSKDDDAREVSPSETRQTKTKVKSQHNEVIESSLPGCLLRPPSSLRPDLVERTVTSPRDAVERQTANAKYDLQAPYDFYLGKESFQ